MIDYSTLNVRIEALYGDRYRAIVRGPDGDGQVEFELSFGERDLDALASAVSRPRSARRRIESDESAHAREFGGELFELIFKDTARDVLRASLAQARRDNRGLRLLLQLDGAPRLRNVPWELLWDSPRFISTSAYSPVLRYVDIPARPLPLALTPPLRILGMVSSPSDMPALDAERERTHLAEACASLTDRGLLQIDWVEDATLAGLLRRLNEGDYHIFHFIGHGDFDEQAEDGVLLFEGRAGRSQRVTGVDLGTILADQHTLRLAVINACEGARVALDSNGIAANLMQYGLPAVIAMQFEISDEAAVAFAGHFYGSVARGRPIDEALADARRGMFADGHGLEWATPVLFTSVDDGRLFEVDWTQAEAPIVVGGKGTPVEPPPPPPPPTPTPPTPPIPPVDVQVTVDDGRPDSGGRKPRFSPQATAVAAVALVAVVAIALLLMGAFSGSAGPNAGRPIAMEPAPVGIVVGGARVWVTSLNTGYLTSIDPRTDTPHKIGLSGKPNGVAIDQNAHVWVVRKELKEVIVLDPANHDRKVVKYRVGEDPNVITFGFGSAWVANSEDGTVSRIDLKTVDAGGEQEAETIPDHVCAKPSGIATTRQWVWVACRGDKSVVRIDPSTNGVLEPIQVDRTVRGIAAEGDGVWVTNPEEGDNSISHISQLGGRYEVTERVGVGVRPTGIAISAGGKLSGIWVANNGGSVTWIVRDGESYRKKAEIRLGREPNGIAVGSGAVWVADVTDNSVTPIAP